jgi:hypothetical protein
VRAGDLNVLIGYNMRPKSCFDRAKHLGYTFVGLQNGNECYAGNRVRPQATNYGQVADTQCNFLCNEDKGKICGGYNLNSVWNIEKYSGNLVELPLCQTRIYEPKDCSQYGGYNPSDLCMETCHSGTMMND